MLHPNVPLQHPLCMFCTCFIHSSCHILSFKSLPCFRAFPHTISPISNEQIAHVANRPHRTTGIVVWQQKVKEPNPTKTYQEGRCCALPPWLFAQWGFWAGFTAACWRRADGRFVLVYTECKTGRRLLRGYKFPLAQWLNTSSGGSGTLGGIIARSHQGLPRTGIECTYLQAAWSYCRTSKPKGSSESRNRGALGLNLLLPSLSIYTQALSG